MLLRVIVLLPQANFILQDYYFILENDANLLGEHYSCFRSTADANLLGENYSCFRSTASD